jgi:hypothetical protein
VRLHHAFEQRYQRLRRQYRRGLLKLIVTGNTLLDPARSPETTLAALLSDLNASELRHAVDICTERHQLEERGEIDALRARYPGLRRYLPAFFALPFQGEPGSDQILQGLELVRQLDAGTLKSLPRLAPTAFVPRKFWPALSETDGTSIGARGNWDWRSRCAMACAPGTSFCPRAVAAHAAAAHPGGGVAPCPD